jgi:hypothetical protein
MPSWGSRHGIGAWDRVRGAFTYNHLIEGGIEGLSTRVKTLAIQRPEFAKVLYGDEVGQRVLSNLDRLGTAFKQASEQAAARMAEAKAAAPAMVDAAREAGVERLASTRSAVQREVRVAQAANADVLAQTAKAGAQDVRAAARAGRDAVDTASMSGRQEKQSQAHANRQAVRDVKGKQTKLMESSIGPYATKTIQMEGAEVARAGLLGPMRAWGAIALMRLMSSPRSKDLIEWSAYSDANTAKMVKILLSPVPPEFLANTLREIGGVLDLAPQPSHATAPEGQP